MRKIKEVRFFVDGKQNNHVSLWLSKLDIQTRSRINLRLVRLEYGSYGDCKSLGNKLYELRFFFADNKKIIVLLCGGNKDTQKKDIKLARDLLKEYKREVGNAEIR